MGLNKADELSLCGATIHNVNLGLYIEYLLNWMYLGILQDYFFVIPH